VVCPDLPGYGASGSADDYSKRATAATLVDLMSRLGHDWFGVVGHGCGALVAFRAALDHPDTTVPAEVRAAYLDAFRTPSAIHAVCEDYRAGAFANPEHDAADRDAGRRIGVPALAIWQDPGDIPLPFDPDAVWRSWAPDLRTAVLPGGHFLPEACPEKVAEAISTR